MHRNHISGMGNIGYFAPEFAYKGEFSTMSDVYSLGVLIIHVVIGEEEKESSTDWLTVANHIKDNARQLKNELHLVKNYQSVDTDGLLQMKACIEIGLQCMEIERCNRPRIVDIIEKISELEYQHTTHPMVQNISKARPRIVDIIEKISELEYQHTTHPMVQNISKAKRRQIKPISTDLLDIYPRQLQFSFKLNKSVTNSSSLQLTNTTDDCIAIRLVTKNRGLYMARMPLCCNVPKWSTYNLIVTPAQRKKPSSPQNVDDILTLESTIVRQGDLNLKSGNLANEYNRLFEKAKEADTRKVYQSTLNVVTDPVEEVTSNQTLQPQIEVISDKKLSHVLSVDVHQTLSWIMTSHHSGDIFIWDCQEQQIDLSFEITQKPVYSAKFIEREKWFVAGDGDGTLHVYNYVTDEEVKSIYIAHDDDITSLDVHPKRPFLLSSSEDRLIKLWDWNKGWECIQTFQGHNSAVTRASFNSPNSDNFVSVSSDQTIKIWSLSSGCTVKSIDHMDGLLCLYKYTGQLTYRLITGSMDGTAQVWNLWSNKCDQKLTGHTDSISSVYCPPKLPIIITGSHDGTIRLWNSSTYRLENIIGFNLGAIYAMGYIESSKRIVVGCHQGMAIMDIDFPES